MKPKKQNKKKQTRNSPFNAELARQLDEYKRRINEMLEAVDAARKQGGSDIDIVAELVVGTSILPDTLVRVMYGVLFLELFKAREVIKKGVFRN